MSPLSLYIHIPFCHRKCPYCHFYVLPDKEDHKKQLLEGLYAEWKRLLPRISNHQIISIYFGGGTPTLFGPKRIGAFLDQVFLEGHLSADCEITLEANPEDITKELMGAYKAVGINRASIGVQSLVDTSLTVLERTHTSDDAQTGVEITAEAGIENISIDLMYELPNQTLESFSRTLALIPQLPISHLSLYNLTIEPHTPFSKRQLVLPKEEENLQMLQLAVEKLESIGLKRYEVSAFAKPGKQSLHNRGYWTGRPFFGLGPSAFSYYGGKRFRNVANLSRYLRALRSGESPVDFSESLPYPDNIRERMALQLRLLEGVDPDLFSLPLSLTTTLNTLEQEGFLEKRGRQISLSNKGLLFYDTVAAELI